MILIMNTFLVILQAQEQAAGAAKGGNWSFIIMMVAVFVVMYFL
jgi:hypothetical protein